MFKLISKISFLLVLIILISSQSSTTQIRIQKVKNHKAMKARDSSKNIEVCPDYGKIPLYFIHNEGQVNDKALFYAKTSKYTLWLTKEGLVFDITRRIKEKNSKSTISIPKDVNNPEDFEHERDVSRLIFLDSNKNPEVVPVDKTEHRVNYFIGSDESKWRSDISTSRAVSYKELYKNIDLKVYGLEKKIEYDFIVRPGGEVSDIRFEYKDVKKTEIDEKRNLVIETDFGALQHAKPVCYQMIEGKKTRIEAEFKKIKKNIYAFRVEEYNKDYELIIDPLILIYSTFLGGSGADMGFGITVDKKGAVYVTGSTQSTDFPTKKPIQRVYGGGDEDVFITKINPKGNALLYSTYLGGDSYDAGDSIAVDRKGAAYVTGYTWSTDFPTKKPIQGNKGGDSHDVFITKINSKGNALSYSTYLGGSKWQSGSSIAVDKQGAAYVTGYTFSNDFPTQNPIQGNSAGNGDAFITKIRSSGTALIYSTYLGGSDGDYGHGIAVDSKGAAYVTGQTNSSNFPIKKPVQTKIKGYYDAFITKINPKGNGLSYSTYLGGSQKRTEDPEESGECIVVDEEGAAYVAGYTNSTNFPLKNAFQETHRGGLHDVFVTKVYRKGSSLIYSTYLGGLGSDRGYSIAVDKKGTAYVAGFTESANFPTKKPLQGTHGGDWDAFITKIKLK